MLKSTKPAQQSVDSCRCTIDVYCSFEGFGAKESEETSRSSTKQGMWAKEGATWDLPICKSSGKRPIELAPKRVFLAIRLCDTRDVRRQLAKERARRLSNLWLKAVFEKKDFGWKMDNDNPKSDMQSGTSAAVHIMEIHCIWYNCMLFSLLLLYRSWKCLNNNGRKFPVHFGTVKDKYYILSKQVIFPSNEEIFAAMLFAKLECRLHGRLHSRVKIQFLERNR